MSCVRVIITLLCFVLVNGYDCRLGSSCIITEDNATLNVHNAFPCVLYSGSVKISNTDLWIVRKNYSQCDTYPSDFALRVTTYLNSSNVSHPLVFVTRNGNNVQTWKLPLHQNYLQVFNSSSHIICDEAVYIHHTPFSTDISMYIDGFSSSSEDIYYDIEIQPVDNFILQLNEKIGFIVLQNSPKVYYFQFPSTYDVEVIVSSNTSGCTIVSVQNASCPLYDTEPNIWSNGIHQTMTIAASITIDERQAQSYEGFFVIVAITDPTHCYREGDNIGSIKGLQSQYIELVVNKQKKASDYGIAIAVPVIVYIVVGLSLAILIGVPCIHFKWNPFVCGRHCCEVHTCRKYQILDENADDDDIQSLNEVSAINESTFTEERSYLNGQKRQLLDMKENSIRLPHLLQAPHDMLEKQYSVYAWNTVTIGIFYGLPAFQLVLTGQLLFRASGNQDTCYFNFKCARPLGVLDAFNNVWSNVGYLILGLTFIILVAIKHYKANKQKSNMPHIYYNYGIPHFFGIYYAFGVALVLEGFMSACYHICPSFDDFQFDSSFMYIITGLLIVKIFQTRHPDIHANAFVAFVCFAVIIFFTLIGIHQETIRYWPVRVVFVLIIVLMVSLVSVSFYFYHDWHMKYWIELDTYKRIWFWLKSWCIPTNDNKTCISIKPRHLGRFMKVIITIISNIIIGMIIIFTTHKEIAVVVLALFITNFLLCTALYLLSKLWHREPWTLTPLAFLVILSVSWIIGFYLLLNVTARREVTPAQSREYNKDCSLLDFYDIHDIWHFVSAIAMFSTFVFVLTMDDGLQDKKRDTINVF